jgi:ubiquinone/menaquinone biosynthesis C-methylase UbiE
MMKHKNIDVFNKDADFNKGYLYTQTDRLSCKMATQRTTDIILETGELKGRRVLDLACGDAFYTIRFADEGCPAQLVATDAALTAVKLGVKKQGSRSIRFLSADSHRLPFANDSFDVVLVQSVLHHDDQPLQIIEEAFRIAPRIIVHEPNGNNPALKIIEKISKYHIEHNERSYGTWRMRHWIRRAGGRVVYEKVAGLVPMFCPDWTAKLLKAVEPGMEAIPGLRLFGCGVYVMVGIRK